MLGARWRESKSRLVADIKAASTCPDSSSRLAMLKPDNIENVQEWNDFVKEKLSEQFEETSNKFRALRGKNKIPHTMSRVGYARLAENMKKESGTSDISRDELWCKAHNKKNGEPPNSVVADCIAKIKEHNSNAQSSPGTTSTNGDGVAKVFGNEHNGRVRGIGFGVAPSQIGIYSANSKKVNALESQVTRLTARVEELTNMFMMSMNGRQNDNVVDMETPRVPTSQSHRDSNNMHQIQGQQTQGSPDTQVQQTQGQQTQGLVEKKCKLLGWEKNAVAEGSIASTDPDTLVHFVKLGPNAWKVWMEAALEPDEFLFRPNSEMFTIKEAVGSPVAWHKDYISFG